MPAAKTAVRKTASTTTRAQTARVSTPSAPADKARPASSPRAKVAREVSAPEPAPRRGRPPANVADKRAAIVAAARAVFARHGLESASMRLIASEAGVAAPTLYLYFKGAEELYGAALSASLSDLGAALASAPAVPGDARAHAVAVTRAYFDFYYARPDDAALGLYLNRGLGPRGLNPELDARLNRELLAALQAMIQALRVLHGYSAKQAGTASFALASACMGVAIFHHTRRDKSLRVDAQAAFEQLLGWVFRA